MEEIVEMSKKHKMLVVTGGGVRVRHILDIGMSPQNERPPRTACLAEFQRRATLDPVECT